MTTQSLTIRFASFLSNPLMGSFGKGSLQKNSAHFREISANFLQNFCTLSCRNKTHFLRNFHNISAEFPQTFCKNPFANDPKSEVLIFIVMEYPATNSFFGTSFNYPPLRTPYPKLKHNLTLGRAIHGPIPV